MTCSRKAWLVLLSAMALAATGASGASATTLEIGGTTQGSAVTVEASLASGTSAILKTTSGTFLDTCTNSEVDAKTSTFTGTPSGAVSFLEFFNCSHTTHVVNNGSLSIERIGSTTNGTVRSHGALVEVEATNFGITLECVTATTDIGTLTGTSSGHAVLHVNAVINCGFFVPSAKWEGSYTVTSPTGLGVVG